MPRVLGREFIQRSLHATGDHLLRGQALCHCRRLHGEPRGVQFVNRRLNDLQTPREALETPCQAGVFDVLAERSDATSHE